ncbi:DUF3349 domain-containing protein [Arsenicicoccus piscis]|uniref:DUF3349 domain-containing protein n=1 Tax=Arsenicicoccus piscis TaxID=673954 RepID=A0ABQ6HQK8_9MICO|nr:DUF3349 domain-containing protein [Arsenicicoccus piscis]MCH8629139.1 DUF3349 domain-containing protein [Arsenicicoccus piscis]GMA20297.1 hypothetical protein GCM10025862_23180 [Arsenicicoccus piscis]
MPTTSSPSSTEHAPTRQSVVQRVLSWLRAGYPHGVPGEDYVALLGILHRQLTEDEIIQVATALRHERSEGEPISEDDIASRIRSQILLKPSPEDVARVSAHLAAAGWPLADPAASPDSDGNL